MRVRLSEGYEPNWDLDLQAGKRGEQFVAAFLEGMVTGTVEVKNDRQAHETGNVWIEYQCRRADGWHDSGIRATKADRWALVLGETVVIGLPTWILRRCVERAMDPALRMLSEEKDGSHPTRGVRIPLRLFVPWILDELRGTSPAAAVAPDRGPRCPKCDGRPLASVPEVFDARIVHHTCEHGHRWQAAA